jgi:hypothetical protein
MEKFIADWANEYEQNYNNRINYIQSLVFIQNPKKITEDLIWIFNHDDGKTAEATAQSDQPLDIWTPAKTVWLEGVWPVVFLLKGSRVRVLR